jgi:hypothetical protein
MIIPSSRRSSMTDNIVTTYGFTDYFIEQRKHFNAFLDKIDQFINWKHIEKLLKKYKKTFSADGRPAIPLYPCSNSSFCRNGTNPVLEETLNDRISLGLSGFSLSPLPITYHLCLSEKLF